MRNLELVFIPTPGVGHILSSVAFAKLLVNHDQRFSITIFVMKFPKDSEKFTLDDSIDGYDCIKFVHLPDPAECDFSKIPMYSFFSSLVEIYKPQVREVVNNIVHNSSATSGDEIKPPKLAAFVIDMFCTPMIDLANEFGLPTYVFFTSGALFLSLEFHLQAIHDEQNFDPTELRNSETELEIPGLANPLPAKMVPQIVVSSKEAAESFFETARGIRKSKGIILNTFLELEPRTLTYLSNDKNLPYVYNVGPILNLGSGSLVNSEIMTWLDDQPPSSVVFLCFGSMGTLPETQLKEIATALERSGKRFLWSLRKPPPPGKFIVTEEYENLSDILPEGFVDRTSGLGKIIGWAPQTAVLGHPAIGGFVSHCGWNSTLESIWFGVPVATWPLFAEQQLNAFLLVKELGLGVEIRMDYRRNMIPGCEEEELVSAAVIERGISLLMAAEETGVRKKVTEMSEKSRNALEVDGSSYTSLSQFIQDLTDNVDGKDNESG